MAQPTVAQTSGILVVYPPSGHTVPAERVLIEGSVAPGATLTIDGQAVEVGPDGVFVTWHPLRAGRNDLRLDSRLGTRTTTSTLRVTSDVSPATPARIVPGSVRPTGTLNLWGLPTDPAGRTVRVEVRGSRGAVVTARLGTLASAALRELPGRPGSFAGDLVIPPGASVGSATVELTLRARDGRTVTAKGGRVVIAAPAARVGVFALPDLGRGVNAFTRAALHPVDDEPTTFLREGEHLVVTGEDERDWRVTLASGVSARVPRASVRLLPASTPLPTPVLSELKVTDGESETEVRLALGERVAFMVSQTLAPGPALELRLPRTTTTPAALTPPVLTGPLLRGVTPQITPDGTTIRFDLAGTQPWGYHAVWEGETLVLRLRHVPNIDPARPLVGRRVVLDAGHGGTERGGMGALGTHEKDLILPITLELARLLRERGAEVILTRDADVTVPLYDRPVLAEDLQSDLLVSVHANAIPDGVDPATRRGAGVYVSHPQARPLAAELLAALVADFPQIGQDREGVFQRSLALTRPSSQPSVLVELGYLTRPAELRLLMDAGARTRFAASLARGLETFLARQAQPSAGKAGSGQAAR